MYLTALAVSGVFYLAYQEWFSWLALLILLGLPWFSLAVSLPAMLKFRSGVLCPQRIPLWGRAEAKLAGWCQLPAPPFRGQVGLKQNFTGENLRKSAAVNLPTAHCGCITVVPEKVRVYDYLGLIGLPLRGQRALKVVVEPQPIPIPNEQEADADSVFAWKPKNGGFSENHELRLYAPGDSLRQIHWKLSAKTGKLILREPMVPDPGRVLVRLVLKGDPEEIDRLLGRFTWLSQRLLEQSIPFELLCLTGSGVHNLPVRNSKEQEQALDFLLGQLLTPTGDLPVQWENASMQYDLGGEPDES